MAKNIEMLKRIKAQWDAVPHSVYMDSWGLEGNAMRREYDVAQNEGKTLKYYNPSAGWYEEYSPEICGTTRCLAGWAIHFDAEDKGIQVEGRTLGAVALEAGHGTEHGYVDWDGAGQKILGLTDSEVGVFWCVEEYVYEKIEDWINNG